MKNAFGFGEARLLSFGPEGFKQETPDQPEKTVQLEKDGSLTEMDVGKVEEERVKEAEEDLGSLQKEIDSSMDGGGGNGGRRGGARNPERSNGGLTINAASASADSRVRIDNENNNTNVANVTIVNGGGEKKAERISEYADKALLSTVWKKYVADLKQFLQQAPRPNLEQAQTKQAELIAKMSADLAAKDSRYGVRLLPGTNVPVLYEREAYDGGSTSRARANLEDLPPAAITNINTIFRNANGKFTPAMVATLNKGAEYYKAPVYWQMGPEGCPPMPYPKMEFSRRS